MTMTAASPIAVRASSVALTAKSRVRSARVAAQTSATRMSSGSIPRRRRPLTSARPMLPPPTIATDRVPMAFDCSECFLSPRPKERRADAHDGGTLQDGRFKIRAHSHGKRIQMGPVRIEARQKLRKLGKRAPLRGAVGYRGWDAHEAAQTQARKRADLFGELRHLLWRHSAL